MAILLRITNSSFRTRSKVSTGQICNVVVYFKDGLKVCHKSYWFITDDNCHDVATVHQVQELVINDLKLAIKDLKSIEYFSDGCAGQYKNRKNFFNLCNHEKDFGLTAELKKNIQNRNGHSSKSLNFSYSVINIRHFHNNIHK